jgi:hypothetical protein
MNLYRVFYNQSNEFKSFTTLHKTKVDIMNDIYKEVATVETETIETLFREMNVVDGTELPVKLKIRSLSVGDIVLDVAAEKCWYCSPIGWTELDRVCFDLLKLLPAN